MLRAASFACLRCPGASPTVLAEGFHTESVGGDRIRKEPSPVTPICISRSATWALRSETPQHVSWSVIQARTVIGGESFRASTEQTLMAFGVYLVRMW
jgi:hypothetical protein